jgi:hypothetical protein
MIPALLGIGKYEYPGLQSNPTQQQTDSLEEIDSKNLLMTVARTIAVL